jgi:hypothetical protein
VVLKTYPHCVSLQHHRPPLILWHPLSPAILASSELKLIRLPRLLHLSCPSAHPLPRRFLLTKCNSPGNVIRSELPPPLLTSLPHDPRTFNIKLSRPQEPQQMLVRESVVSRSWSNPLVRRVRRDQVLRFEERAELGKGLLLCGITVNTKVSAINACLRGNKGQLTGARGDRIEDLCAQTWWMMWYR